MRHPALRRSARHTSRREARADSLKSSMPPAPETPVAPEVVKDQPSADLSGQNRPAPGTPPDGDHNQGGVRKEGIDYQRDLGSEQDA